LQCAAQPLGQLLLIWIPVSADVPAIAQQFE
jgi:hypothetical protein